jgi:hypothetical protein
MTKVSWEAFEAEIDAVHRDTREKVYGYMESGHHGAARELIAEYSKLHRDKAEALRLALVRDFGTGL